MKKLIIGMVLAVSATLGVSCINASFVVRGNGKAVKGAFDIPLNYRELSVVSGITVILVSSEVGEGFITADEEVMEYVSIVEKDGRVRVSYDPHINVRTGVETVVTMPVSRDLSRLDASSAAKILCETLLVCARLDVESSSAAMVDIAVEAQEIDVDLSSAAKCKLTADCGSIHIEGGSAARFEGNVVARELYADFGSSAKCEVEGTADRCDVEAGSASGFRGYGFVCKEAYLDASSAGSVEITVTEELVVDVSSGGAVRYKGVPRVVHSDVSSGGSLRQI